MNIQFFFLPFVFSFGLFRLSKFKKSIQKEVVKAVSPESVVAKVAAVKPQHKNYRRNSFKMI